MTILFYNIFVGIATYEIRQILHNSNIEITLTKIEYIFRLEKRFGCSRVYKWLDNGIKLIERFFWTKSFITFKSRKQRVNTGKELLKQQNETNERLLIELKQMTSLMLNKFDFIEKRIEKIERVNK